MPRVATLRDVADRAGVHPSTVSRALNPATRDLVNAKTSERVTQAAEELGYRPNSLARGLKTNKTFSIGMLLPDLTNPLFPPIVRGIEDVLGSADYTLILGNTDNDDARERSLLASLMDRRVDGLILATAHRKSPQVDQLMAEKFPLVLVNRTVDDSRVHSVTTDDQLGVRLAVRHLVDLGHERIAHIAGPQDLSTGLDRYRAFTAAIRAAGLEVDSNLVSFADSYSEDAGARALWTILDNRTPFTAIIAANDLLAIGCYDVLNDVGTAIGDEVSVVGFNDIPFADKLAPPLTTVRIHHYEIGTRAGQVMVELLDDEKPSPPMSYRLAPTLIVRRSTGPGRAKDRL